MSFLCVDTTEEMLAKYLVNKSPSAAEDVVLRLFKNNKTPGDTDTAGAYTEADFSGYSHYDINSTEWSISPNAPTLITGPEITFQATGTQASQNIYGYYMTQVSSGLLLSVWRFDDGPYVITEDGDKILVTPKISIKKPAEVS